MNKDFIELTKENLPSGNMSSGKIIKATSVKVVNKNRIISNERDNVQLKENIENKSKKEDLKNIFTFDPKYSNDELKELDVSCSCGNYTKIVFNKDEESEEESPMPQAESEEESPMPQAESEEESPMPQAESEEESPMPQAESEEIIQTKEN